MTTTAATTTIESKLQGVAAAYRRDRDEAHRRKQLALERLKLTQQEYDAAKQSLQCLQTKLQTLQQQSGAAEVLTELETLKQDVARLTQQVDFQHKELIGMRDKLNSLKQQEAIDSARRQTAILKLQTAMKPRRELVLKLKQDAASGTRTATTDAADYGSNRPVHKKHKTISSEESGDPTEAQAATATTESGRTSVAAAAAAAASLKEKLLRELQEEEYDHHRFSLLNKWPRIIHAKAEALAHQTALLHSQADELEFLVVRYEKQFGFSSSPHHQAQQQQQQLQQEQEYEQQQEQQHEQEQEEEQHQQQEQQQQRNQQEQHQLQQHQQQQQEATIDQDMEKQLQQQEEGEPTMDHDMENQEDHGYEQVAEESMTGVMDYEDTMVEIPVSESKKDMETSLENELHQEHDSNQEHDESNHETTMSTTTTLDNASHPLAMEGTVQDLNQNPMEQRNTLKEIIPQPQ